MIDAKEAQSNRSHPSCLGFVLVKKLWLEIFNSFPK
jgi:hypothetical protein